MAKRVTAGDVNTNPTLYELQNTYETSVKYKKDAKKKCNKCSVSQNCFKNYVNNSSKKVKDSSLILAPKKSPQVLVRVEMDVSNKASANKSYNKLSVSKSSDKNMLPPRQSKESFSCVLSGLVYLYVHIIQYLNLSSNRCTDRALDFIK